MLEAQNGEATAGVGAMSGGTGIAEKSSTAPAVINGTSPGNTVGKEAGDGKKNLKDPAVGGGKEDEDSKSSDEQGEDPGKEEVQKKKKKLTEEEQAALYDETLQKSLDNMDKLSQCSIRCELSEDRPFTKAFRQCMLVICMTYFALKLNQFRYNVIYKFRQELVAGLMKYQSIPKICDALAESLELRDFMKPSGAMLNDYWFPVKNSLLALVNFSDASEEVREQISQHPELLPLMAKMVREMTDKHLEQAHSDNQTKLLKWMLSIFHNCGMKEELVPRLRELDIIDMSPL